jgi:hypothetical protein
VLELEPIQVEEGHNPLVELLLPVVITVEVLDKTLVEALALVRMVVLEVMDFMEVEVEQLLVVVNSVVAAAVDLH